MSTSMLVPGFSSADRADRLGDHRGPAVGQIVARDHGDDDVLQAHEPRGLGHAPRLVEIGDGRATGVDGAEAAVPGADAAEDHEGRGAERPALAEVRAARLLAHRVEGLVAEDVLRVRVRRTGADADLEPLRASPSRPGVLGNRVAGGQQPAVDLRSAGVHDLRG